LIAVSTASIRTSSSGSSQRGCKLKRVAKEICSAMATTTEAATGNRFSGPVGLSQAGTHSVSNSTARLAPPRESPAHIG
jgi:hypothetical protein